MQTLIISFILLQIVLFFIMTFHDWVHVPPLTDIRALEKNSSIKGRIINSIIFALFVLIPLTLTGAYASHFPTWVVGTIAGFYGVLSLGTIASWWIPYLFGSSDAHKEAFSEYKATHHFLPARGDNVVPNTFHVILHVLIWSCFFIACYLLKHG